MDPREEGAVLEMNTTGRQARYTDAGSRHRNRSTNATQTQEPRCTGTQGHANTGSENGTGKKRISKAEKTR
ncbi:hypothetical protein ARMSODRAFT_953803 [Armillaria solidipes]|uniref:Uncharacterized protein n=1 Tax=Armillaria solidipes TaxID=1076256 RepID=A0A2H3C5N7_9AGAR|nr:hypothetical protein ARMSODRAFT_953803 [Armillaria solidipes]